MFEFTENLDAFTAKVRDVGIRKEAMTTYHVLASQLLGNLSCTSHRIIDHLAKKLEKRRYCFEHGISVGK